MVLVGIEPTTSSLLGARSNRLSYRTVNTCLVRNPCVACLLGSILGNRGTEGVWSGAALYLFYPFLSKRIGAYCQRLWLCYRVRITEGYDRKGLRVWPINNGRRGLNSGSSACKADVIATRPRPRTKGSALWAQKQAIELFDFVVQRTLRPWPLMWTPKQTKTM